VVLTQKYAIIITAAIAAAIAAATAVTAAAVLKATSEESQPYSPIARAVAAEQARIINIR
jgi:hypothetical protein